MRRSILIVTGVWLGACTGGEETRGADEAGTGKTAAVAAPPPGAMPVESVSVPLDVEVEMAPMRPSGDSVVIGVVRTVGAVPLEQLVLQSGGSSVSLKGTLREELAKLEGARVRVWGKPSDNAPPTPPRALDVTGYEIVSVGGATPVVGVLTLRGGVFHVVGKDTVQLATVPERLRTKPGAKVWLIGPREGDLLRVQAYGILREPQ